MKPFLSVLLALVAVVATTATASAQEPERPFQIGFADSLFGGSEGNRWAGRVAEAGADAVRVNVYWSLVGPEEPGDPRDPADPAYDFTAIDQAVRSADAAGLDVLMTVLSAPRWAEGPYRPSYDDAPAGTWRPDPRAFGDFAHAIALRYSGSFDDPVFFGPLPEVDLYSAWNEPNISAYLTPQFEDGVNQSSETYVGLLNSFYDEVKQVNPDATVATGGTAPFGDPVERRRTPPLDFWRGVMCLTDSLEEADFCAAAEKPRFDVLAHHPISYLSSPNVPATHPGDVTVADFGALVDVLRAAEERGTVEPAGAGAHSVIAPEIWWETNPPERRGVSFRRQARYTALGLHLLWRQGVDGVWFLQVRDSERSDEDTRLTSYQTGVYTYAGRRKPAYRAVRFPFVTTRSGRGVVRAWGRAPEGGRLRIEVKRSGGRWRRAEAFGVGAGEIFTEAVSLKGKALVRAKVSGERSLGWRQRR